MSRDRILIVDDDRSLLELLELQLAKRGIEATTTPSPARALELLDSDDFDCVLSDIGMEPMSGLELCRRIVESKPHLPVIMLTGSGTMQTAVEALRAGAYDFVTKPVEADLLAASLKRAIGHTHLHRELHRLKREVPSVPQGILGSSPAIKRTFDLIDRIATSDVSVLVTGETGTGKEVVARAIHEKSGRNGPFVAINCAAMPGNLLESELFGHAKGAFTDAKSQRTGLFVEARGGTIFLDEIGELPIDLQPKLLRVLQERVVRPVGSNAEIAIEVRIITATNRDLESAVEQKTFREDLFYRINVVTIGLPPLRERGGDVLLLATHFLKKFAERSKKGDVSFSAPAAKKVVEYPWPGNVRELENCMERAVALARGAEILVDDLPERVVRHEPTRLVVDAEAVDELISLSELERRYIQKVLALVAGNKTRAAQILGVDRRTLYRKLDGEEAAKQEKESSTPS